MNSFSVGDVVKLKSGGPKMTVVSVEADLVDCSWFKNEELMHGSFVPDSLEK